MIFNTFKQKVMCKETKKCLGVEEYKNGNWSWYVNEFDGGSMTRIEGKGRILADFPIEYIKIDDYVGEKVVFNEGLGSEKYQGVILDESMYSFLIKSKKYGTHWIDKNLVEISS